MNIIVSNEESKNNLIKFVVKDRSTIEDFNGDEGKITIRYENNNKVIYVGIGDEVNNKVVRNGIANAIRKANENKWKSISISVPDSNEDFTNTIVEGAILGNYSFDKYLSEKKEKVEEIEIVGATKENIEQSQILCNAITYGRDLINENAEIVTPLYLEEEAKKIAASSDKIELEILTEKEIQEKGLGLLWAVGKGSSTPPRLIIINYKGNQNSADTKAIVGKGVTFDSGGLNLKPSGFIETMKHDMSGAAVVLSTIKAIAELDLPINVTAVVTTAQNAISNTAYFPGDIITGYNGTSVEVLNTDAEGRLCLADAISYVNKNYKPTEIINLATLTGAVVIALGDTIAGLFSNNRELAQKLFETGEKVDESLWELPIRKEHREAIKSSVADLQNISKKSRNASSITAAAFLEHFVDDTPWAHIDIAGTSWNKESESGINSKHATGFGIRLLMEYLSN